MKEKPESGSGYGYGRGRGNGRGYGYSSGYGQSPPSCKDCQTICRPEYEMDKILLNQGYCNQLIMVVGR